MKWIEWAIVGVLLFLPFVTVNRIDTETLRQVQLTELRYDAVLNAAVDDAASMLIMNAAQRQEAEYASAKRVALDKEEALETFFGRWMRDLA